MALDAVECAHDVIINDEKQFSIWPQNLSVPDGWKAYLTGTRLAGHDVFDAENVGVAEGVDANGTGHRGGTFTLAVW
jgi:hypothetical protein